MAPRTGARARRSLPRSSWPRRTARWRPSAGSPAAAYSLKNGGNTAVMTVVQNAEFAQSYIAQARSSGRSRPSRASSPVIVRTSSARPTRAAASRRRRSGCPSLEQQVLLDERRQRGLDARRSAEPMAGARVGREQLASALQHDRAQHAALRQRQPLPDRLEHRLLLGEQPRQRRVQVVEGRPSSTGGADVVPRLVREPLHVVGQVAGEIDDRRAEAGLGANPALREARLDERRRRRRAGSSRAA